MSILFPSTCTTAIILFIVLPTEVMIGGRTVIFAYGRRGDCKDLKMRGSGKEKGILTRFVYVLHKWI